MTSWDREFGPDPPRISFYWPVFYDTVSKCVHPILQMYKFCQLPWKIFVHLQNSHALRVMCYIWKVSLQISVEWE